MGGTSLLSSLAVARPGHALLDRRIWVQGQIQACMPQHVRIARRTLRFGKKGKQGGEEEGSNQDLKFTVRLPVEPADDTNSEKQTNRRKDRHSPRTDEKHSSNRAGPIEGPVERKWGTYNILMCGSDAFSFIVFHRLLAEGACKRYRMVSPPLREFEINRNVHRRVSPIFDWTEKYRKPHSFATDNMEDFVLPEPFDVYRPNNVLLTASFGRLIPQSMMQNFEYCLNVHPSLLPDLPGADPITHAIAKRRTKTGITVQTLGPTFDSGEVLAQIETKLRLDMDYRNLNTRLKRLAPDLVSAVMNDLPTFMARATPQSKLAADIPFSRAPKVSRNFKRINWGKMSAGDIEARLRALPDPISHLKTYLHRGTNKAGEESTSEIRVGKCYPMSSSDYTFLLEHSKFGPQLRKLLAAPAGSAMHFDWPRKHGGSEIPTGSGTLVVKCVGESMHQPEEWHVPEGGRRRYLNAKLGSNTKSEIILIKSPQYGIYKQPIEHLLCISKLFKKNGFSPIYSKSWKNGFRKSTDPHEIFQFVTDPIVKEKAPEEKRSDASVNDTSGTTSIGKEKTDDDASGETDATSDDESARSRYHDDDVMTTVEANRKYRW